MSPFVNKSIAILGIGKSGVSVAKAALELGARPMVFDERPISGSSKEEAARELGALGVSVQGDWDGSLSDTGCDLIVTSPGVPMRNPRLQQAVEEGLEVLSEVEFAYRISKAPIVAITGTNGKSTTTAMTWLCLKAAGVDAVLCGNIAGSGYPEMPLTDAALRSTSDQILVAEISSFQLEFVRDFRPIAATITTLTEDHLNRYKGFAEYAAMKYRIFRNMACNGIAVWNLDDPATKPPEGVEIWGYRGLGESGIGGESGESGESGENGENGENGESGIGGGNGETRPGLRAWESANHLRLLGLEIAKSDLPFSEPHNFRNALSAALLAAAVLERRPFWTAATGRRFESADLSARSSPDGGYGPEDGGQVRLGKSGDKSPQSKPGKSAQSSPVGGQGPEDGGQVRLGKSGDKSPQSKPDKSARTSPDDGGGPEDGGQVRLGKSGDKSPQSKPDLSPQSRPDKSTQAKKSPPLGDPLDGLRAFKPLEHRMEHLGERNGIAVINNSMCTNPGAVIASSQSLKGPQRLLLGGENKELAFAPVKEYLEQSGHAAYLFGKDAMSINAQLGGRWPVFEKLSQAFAAARQEAQSGDTIMLAPGVASTDQFLDFRDRGVQFRAMAKAWLDGG